MVMLLDSQLQCEQKKVRSRGADLCVSLSRVPRIYCALLWEEVLLLGAIPLYMVQPSQLVEAASWLKRVRALQVLQNHVWGRPAVLVVCNLA